MAAKNVKKNIILRNFFAFLNAYYPKTHLIKSHNSLNSSRSYGRLLENQKTGGSRKLFPSENDFQTSSAVNFPKKTSRFWRPGNQLKT